MSLKFAPRYFVKAIIVEHWKPKQVMASKIGQHPYGSDYRVSMLAEAIKTAAQPKSFYQSKYVYYILFLYDS